MQELSSAQILMDWSDALDRRSTTIAVGRQTGVNPSTTAWTSCRACVKGYRPDQLVGTTVQGEVSIWVFWPDLIKNSFPVPVRISDKVRLSSGVETRINAVDANTGTYGGSQIFLKIMAVG